MEKNYNIPNSKIVVNNETAIKPYWYYRNKLFHIRYTVDRCIELSDSEAAALKETLSNTCDKQEALAKSWNFFAEIVKRPIINDGIAEIDKRMKEAKNGR